MEKSQKSAWITGGAAVIAALIMGIFTLYQGFCTSQNNAQEKQEVIDGVKKPSLVEKSSPQEPVFSGNEESHEPFEPTSKSNILAEEISYDITIIIPSRMNDARILIDGEPAIVIESLPTQKMIRINKKETNHVITLKREGMQLCEKEFFVQEDGLVITPCQ